MLIADPNSLREYLSSIARDPTLVGPVLRDLQPMFDHAARVRFDLGRLEPLLAGTAISLASGQPVRGLEPLSLAAGFDLSGVSWSTFDRVNGRPNTKLMVELGFSRWECLHTRLWVNLWDGLDHALWNTLMAAGLPETAAQRLYAGLTANLHEATYDLAGFAALGDSAETSVYRGLTRFLSRVIPLGERTDRPGIWLVVTA